MRRFSVARSSRTSTLRQTLMVGSPSDRSEGPQGVQVEREALGVQVDPTGHVRAWARGSRVTLLVTPLLFAGLFLLGSGALGAWTRWLVATALAVFVVLALIESSRPVP